jgi:hypothetical protein
MLTSSPSPVPFSLPFAFFRFRVFSLVTRWGHDLQLLPSPPTLLITSGKTPSTNGQTYTSTPSSPSYVSIPLSAPFSLADVASLANVSTGIAPDAAWGSGQVLSDGGAWWFGGEAGGGGAQTASDSLWRRAKEGGNWERSTDETQPMRRLGGASCSESRHLSTLLFQLTYSADQAD